MLTERTVNDGVIECLYESSTIFASKYDTNSGTLIITFNKGSRYQYSGVNKRDYTRFETDESQGRILNSHIKSYHTTKLSNVDLNEIIKNVITDINSSEKEFSKLLKTIITEFDTKHTIPSINLCDIIEGSVKLLKERNNK